MNTSTGLNQYKVGGSLGANHPTYVTRQADRDLLAALSEGQFCYVFNCRQMGKSSLRVRVMRDLRSQHKTCVAIDMSVLGGQAGPQQWYGGLITQLWQGLQLMGAIPLKPWLTDHAHLSPVQQLSQFLDDILCIHRPDDHLVILIDEIDKVLSLPFSLDDFFALIRFCYNQRADHPAYHRLTFALFGVATPADLIRDKTQTLFNIGQGIALAGFQLQEADPLTQGLATVAADPTAVLTALLAWTGGQPFLTQKLCALMATSETVIAPGAEAAAVASMVQTQVIRHWESQDQPVHFKTIRDRILRDPQRLGALLGLYQTLWQQGQIPIDNSREQSELRLSGLVVQHQDHLQIYNRIYREIFNQTWIDDTFAQLRPYAVAIAAWEACNRQDPTHLLQDETLRAAQEWATHNQLSSQDYQFLAASQALDNQRKLAAEREARAVERLETQLAAETRANQKLAADYAEAKRRLHVGSGVLAASLLVAAIATGWLAYTWQQQHHSRVQSLEWAGKSALQQFDFNQIEALLTAMQASQTLKSMVTPGQLYEDYPTPEPFLALQAVLDSIWEQNRLEGHDAAITSVSFSPDGRQIATASDDNTAILWNRAGQVIKVLEGHAAAVNCVAYSPDGQTLATASQDGTVNLWSSRGDLLQTLTGHRAGMGIYTVTFSPDGTLIATASQDGTARLWNRQGQEQVRLDQHRDAVFDISFSPDGQTLATTSRDRTVKLWTLTGQEQLTISGHRRPVFAVSFSPDGQLLATASQDRTVKLWTRTGDLRQTFKGHQKPVNDVKFSPDGQHLVTAAGDTQIKLWTLAGQELKTLRGHQRPVFDLSFSADGRQLATASGDQTVKLWTLPEQAFATELTPIPPDQGSVRSQTQAEPAQTKRNRRPEDLQPKISSRRLSPDGQRWLTAFENGGIRLDSDRRYQGTTFAPQGRGVASLAFSPNGQQFASASPEGYVTIWTNQTQVRTSFPAHETRIHRLQFSPNGQFLATAGKDGLVKVWDLNGNEQGVLEGHDDAVYAVAFSADSQRLVTASQDKTAKVWQRNGQLLATFAGHYSAVHDAAFSPDGQHLATASRDGTAKLWALSGTELQTLPHGSRLVYRVRFSPDGQHLVTGTNDGRVQLWNRKGQLMSVFTGHRGLVRSLRFRGEQVVAIAEQDPKPKVWPAQTTTFARIESHLQRGCTWLQDYFASHPEDKPAVCKTGP